MKTYHIQWCYKGVSNMAFSSTIKAYQVAALDENDAIECFRIKCPGACLVSITEL